MSQNKTDTLLRALQGIDYPATAQDIVQHAESRGVEAIAWQHGKTIRLNVIFERYPERAFLSDEDVTNAVSAIDAGDGFTTGPITPDASYRAGGRASGPTA